MKILFVSLIAFCLTLVKLQGQAVQLVAQATDKGEPQDLSKEIVNVIQEQLQAIRDHDLDKAYYAYTSQDFRTATPREAFRRFIFANVVLAQNQSAEFQEPQFQNRLAIVKGELLAADGTKHLVEYALAKEEEQWRILGIKIYDVPAANQSE